MPNDLTVRQDSVGYIVPTSLGEVAQMAQAICKTGMVPNQFRGKPDETAAALLFALEQGLPPVTGLRFIANINGVNALFGDAIPGLAMRKNLIKNMREWFDGTGDQFAAYCEVERPDGSKVMQTFSVAAATKARLWGKAGPWSQYPARMLQMRARSWAVRDAAPHAFLGPTYEELVGSEGAVEVDPERARDITPPQTAAERKAAMLAADHDPETGEVVEAEAPAPTPPAKPGGSKMVTVWLGPNASIEAPAPEALMSLVQAIDDVGYESELNALLENNAALLARLKNSNWDRMTAAIGRARDRLASDVRDDPMADVDDLDDLPPEEDEPSEGKLL